jgi:phosphoribosylaminoimidazole-succinocarboxamide synthase
MIENLEKFNKLYEGKAKILYETSDPNYLIQYFKDDLTAGNGEKKDSFIRKGIFNQYTSTKIYEYLHECKVPTHLIKSINNREQVVKKLSIFPIEVVIRNIAAGSICRRYNIRKGHTFSTPLLELFYKDDSLNDPLINESAVIEMGLVETHELFEIKRQAHIINQRMEEFWKQYKITLVDAKYEFGLDENLGIVLGDEITLDTMRLWNKDKESLDKDLFRDGYNMKKVTSVYQYIYDLVKES